MYLKILIKGCIQLFVEGKDINAVYLMMGYQKAVHKIQARPVEYSQCISQCPNVFYFDIDKDAMESPGNLVPRQSIMTGEDIDDFCNYLWRCNCTFPNCLRNFGCLLLDIFE